MDDDSDEPADWPSEFPDEAADMPPRAPGRPGNESLVADKHVDITEEDELVHTIVSEVGKVRGVAVTELRPTLQESIDVDALVQVLSFDPDVPYRSGWVTFFFAGCRIVLNGNQRLQIYDRISSGQGDADK